MGDRPVRIGRGSFRGSDETRPALEPHGLHSKPDEVAAGFIHGDAEIPVDVGRLRSVVSDYEASPLSRLLCSAVHYQVLISSAHTDSTTLVATVRELSDFVVMFLSPASFSPALRDCGLLKWLLSLLCLHQRDCCCGPRYLDHSLIVSAMFARLDWIDRECLKGNNS